MKSIFEYGSEEVSYLKKRDKKLGEVIDRMGIIEREVTPDPFIALISCIVSQQISNKAAETVWNRLENELGQITPEKIATSQLEIIQACGMSIRKASYIKGIADSAVSGAVDFGKLHLLSDTEIIKQLSALHGVGVWTVEMLLIFSFCRTDVLSYRDLAIRRGIQNLYGLKSITKEQFQKYRKRYTPYGTIASFYLWALS